MEHSSDELVNVPSLLPEGLVNLAKDIGEKSKQEEFENTQDSLKTQDEFESYKSKNDYDFDENENGEAGDTPETMALEEFADVDPDPSPVNTHEVLQR